MLFHVGGDTLVWLHEVIGIFDVQTQEIADTRAFLERMRALGRVEVVDAGELKSLIVTDRKVYLSPVSPQTLRRRAELVEQTGRIEINHSE